MDSAILSMTAQLRFDQYRLEYMPLPMGDLRTNSAYMVNGIVCHRDWTSALASPYLLAGVGMAQRQRRNWIEHW